MGFIQERLSSGKQQIMSMRWIFKCWPEQKNPEGGIYERQTTVNASVLNLNVKHTHEKKGGEREISEYDWTGFHIE